MNKDTKNGESNIFPYPENMFQNVEAVIIKTQVACLNPTVKHKMYH